MNININNSRPEKVLNALEGFDPSKHLITSDLEIEKKTFLSNCYRKIFNPSKYNPKKVARSIIKLTLKVGSEAVKKNEGFKNFTKKMKSGPKIKRSKQATITHTVLDKISNATSEFFKDGLDSHKSDLSNKADLERKSNTYVDNALEAYFEAAQLNSALEKGVVQNTKTAKESLKSLNVRIVAGKDDRGVIANVTYDLTAQKELERVAGILCARFESGTSDHTTQSEVYTIRDKAQKDAILAKENALAQKKAKEQSQAYNSFNNLYSPGNAPVREGRGKYSEEQELQPLLNKTESVPEEPNRDLDFLERRGI